MGSVVAPVLWSTDSVVMARGLSCSKAHGIVPDQRSNPRLWHLHWQVDYLPLSHHGSLYPRSWFDWSVVTWIILAPYLTHKIFSLCCCFRSSWGVTLRKETGKELPSRCLSSWSSAPWSSPRWYCWPQVIMFVPGKASCSMGERAGFYLVIFFYVTAYCVIYFPLILILTAPYGKMM